jgi:hypothetical protein
MIVWLASFPRSGNGFFRVVCRTLFDINVYSIYPEARATVDADAIQKMSLDPKLYLVKTHELPSDAKPAIYLARDGRDSFVSLTWFNLTSQGKPEQDISEDDFQSRLKAQILSRDFGGWSAHVLGWTRRSAQTEIVKFENLIHEPEKVVLSALQSVGFEVERNKDGTYPSFEKLHKNNPHLYRKGKVGNWEAQMSPELRDLFWKEHGQAMDLMAYPR